MTSTSTAASVLMTTVISPNRSDVWIRLAMRADLIPSNSLMSLRMASMSLRPSSLRTIWIAWPMRPCRASASVESISAILASTASCSRSTGARSSASVSPRCKVSSAGASDWRASSNG